MPVAAAVAGKNPFARSVLAPAYSSDAKFCVDEPSPGVKIEKYSLREALPNCGLQKDWQPQGGNIEHTWFRNRRGLIFLAT
jgi:hypothetical protein